MKYSSSDLEELNYWYKNLDVDLDASECNLDSFLHETCLLAEFSCHLLKIISPSYDIILAEIWRVYRSLSKESKKIEFSSIGLRKLQILNFEWPKVNTGRMRDLTLQDMISMIFLFLFCLHYISRKVWMLVF